MILIVDDDQAIRMAVSELLNVIGYPNKTADGGQDALDILDKNTFDAILLDLTMPHIDGYQVLQYIRADSRLSDVPVIVLSALKTEENTQYSISMGASAFLAKPFKFTELESCLKSVLG